MTVTTVQPYTDVHRPPSWWERQSDRVMRRPFNEFTFTHMNWLLPTARVARGPVRRPLPSRPAPLDVRYSFRGREFALADFHRRSFTTTFVVLRRGRIVHERYRGVFAGPRTRMQVFSLSKSVTSILVGAALADGLIGGVTDRVTDYRPDFLGTAYDGVTIADLLDMRSGAGDQEIWGTDTAIRRFERAILSGGDVPAIVRSVPRTALPGTRFNYSTFDAQVLSWVLEAATGSPLAAYASRRLWQPMESDAYYGLSRSHPRTAIGAGALNATARDLARVGLHMLAHPALQPRPGGVYSNQWWTFDQGRFAGIGVHGQYLFVDPAASVVIVKTSAWPVEEDETLEQEAIIALTAVARYLHEH
ncbi:serine hydrolase domain-containing protein [Actinoplanes sp. NPDC049265]|uniref:serine hydrolase domain-containing protein n=1 Tax=Actinoplanes sp. NPDC049265 TaxID=3363902 RepID=UPI003719EA7B